MLEQFQHHLNQLIQPTHRILLAVSGGLDSITLVHLCSQSKIDFGIAHCNFKLRGKDADEDAAFVQKLAQQYSVPFHTIDFKTAEIANTRKSSIQITARNLRYEWFEKIRLEYQYNLIATAHHANDSIETFLINFSRGTGLKGLLGIPKQNKYIIRPLLFALRQDLEKYVLKNGLSYREDSSNLEDKYIRNKVRLHLIPLLKELNPSFEKNALQTIQHLQENKAFIQEEFVKIKKELFFIQNDIIKIDSNKLSTLKSKKLILFELLSPLGFNGQQCEQIINQPHQAGKTFFSTTHRLLIDRIHYLISPIKKYPKKNYVLSKHLRHLELSKFSLKVELLQNDLKYQPSKKIAYLDLGKLSFPLTLRRWQAGDFFHPIGMDGKKKKLKKYFSDLKLSLLEKESIWVLTSNKKICWVVGYRIDERFKITPNTKDTYKLTIIPKSQH